VTLSNVWRKSERSNEGGACVQARLNGGGVEIGDTKDPNGPTLVVGKKAFVQFVEDLKAGRHNG
jgi:hypothetical protein